MQDVMPSLDRWREDQEDIAVATVVNTWGSAPRPVGAKMVTTLSGGIAGSVSGGCVEGAVIEEAKHVMQSGQPRLLQFGVADEEAWEVGLACGGEIRVFVEPFEAVDGVYNTVKQHLADRQPLAVVSVLEGPEKHLNHKLIVLPDGTIDGDLSLPDQQESIVQQASELLAQGEGSTLEIDDMLLFAEVYPPTPRLIIVGAVHITEALIPIAHTVGFDTVIVDPRAAFATRERFPSVTKLVQEWPQHALSDLELDGAAYVVVLTHDPKIDDPALRMALASDARYIGALGSTSTNRKRIARLHEAGLPEAQIERLHAPIGLPLGGRSPAEIAVSIMAEIVKVKNDTPAHQPASV